MIDVISKGHIPVLLLESLDGLSIQPDDVVVDATFGGGGHTAALIASYGNSITLACVDLDEEARSRYDAMTEKGNTTFVLTNYKNADLILESIHQKNANKVLLDIGTSSFQLDYDTRGFSFNSDATLSMTLSHAGSHTGFSAHDIVNEWSEESIADIIFYYGEESFARVIAKAIVSTRASAAITTAKQLSSIISACIRRKGRLHPATKTFQALRIAVNDELTVLKDSLNAWWQHLSPGGRIAVITFHSLEDRVVKQWMKDLDDTKRIITKKPITPTDEEIRTNPRSRSAKLRIIEKQHIREKK